MICAGFGKTTLLVDWLKQIDLPAAWLSLDEAGHNLPRFLAYLAVGLRLVDDEFGAPLRSALQSPQLPAIEKLLTALLNKIALRIDIYLSEQPRDPVKELIHLYFTQEQKNHSFFVLIYLVLTIRGIYKLSEFLYDVYTIVWEVAFTPPMDKLSVWNSCYITSCTSYGAV